MRGALVFSKSGRAIKTSGQDVFAKHTTLCSSDRATSKIQLERHQQRCIPMYLYMCAPMLGKRDTTHNKDTGAVHMRSVERCALGLDSVTCFDTMGFLGFWRNCILVHCLVKGAFGVGISTSPAHHPLCVVGQVRLAHMPAGLYEHRLKRMHADAVICTVTRWMDIVIAPPVAFISPVQVGWIPVQGDHGSSPAKHAVPVLFLLHLFFSLLEAGNVITASLDSAAS
jgi:hypothetical protein